MANKKINQLVAKTTIQSTDLFPIGDASTGTLYKKTIADLQAAIGGAVISVNGLVGTVVLDTDDILEPATPTNKYFTDARARAAISLTTTGSSGASTYSSSTGVLNVPTYTLAGLGGITATFLSGGTGITYDSGTGVIATTITQYTDALARAAISGTSPITYNSTTGAIGITGSNLTESTSSVLTITGGTGALLSAASIQVKQASGSQSGFLSSTDWTTFNSKQTALSGGTAGYVTFWTNGSSLGADSAHFWDNTNKRLGIGTTSPSYKFAVLSSPSAGGFDGINVTTGLADVIGLYRTGSTYSYGMVGSNQSWIYSAYGDLNILTDASSTSIKFGTSGGTERMRILSDGKVGIGTTSPAQILDINSASSTDTDLKYNLIIRSSDAYSTTPQSGLTFATYFNSTQNLPLAGIYGGKENATINDFASKISFATRANGGNITERMRITSAGNVGIGITSPSYILHTYKSQNSATEAMVLNDNTGSSTEAYTSASNGTYSMRLGMRGTGTAAYQGLDTNSGVLNYDGNTSMTINASSSSSVIKFTTNGFLERMRITNGGNILMGTTTDNGERLYVSGAIRATGTITANSDISLKKNLAKIENALEKVEQINGYTYEFKENDSKRHAGVIAQEIQGVLPEIVNKGNDGLLGVEYGNISALLIEAIKEQQAQINELKALLNK